MEKNICRNHERRLIKQQHKQLTDNTADIRNFRFENIQKLLSKAI